ncbi:DUF1778 domain-containing protein [Pseudomonas neustonica]|uniref:DUF1778 domain-containing protein n=1 Tax=Pseudomonas neustonica TaxID=2487346 RepID=A0ABX9XFG0_9PSED|nr:DUF1778 domain-containing protein [Pseudomonas sp. SSM44]ROZ80025.1 DUF1778 domain-containing protein [Pseudomonas neustonica]
MTDADQCGLDVNFNSDELDRIKRAADICGQPVSEFIVDAAFDKAVRTILTDKVAFMSDDAYQTACRTILDLHGKGRG